MSQIVIGNTLTKSGFTVRVGSNSFTTAYPQEVWNSLPQSLRPNLADTASYFFTHHLAIQRQNTRLMYQFPTPALRSLLFHGLVFSLPASVLELSDKRLTPAELLRKTYESDFRLQFSGPTRLPVTDTYKANPNKAIMAFSFGKDSLLSFAFAKELGVTVYPILFLEPSSPLENANKMKLATSFAAVHTPAPYMFRNSLGSLRQGTGAMWGWDMLLTQYSLLFVPFTYTHRAAYVFWSNEQSLNGVEHHKTGYTLNPTHEQSSDWVLNLSSLFCSFGSPARAVSLVEPLHELAILWILHTKYPAIGRFQHSCVNDPTKPESRWCGNCYECARVYIFLTALGIDPKIVGFSTNMLNASKRKLFYLFDDTHASSTNSLFQSYPERILAFYIAHKRGVKEDLVQLFGRRYSGRYEAKKMEFLNRYAAVRTPRTIPPVIWKKLKPLITAHVSKLYKALSAWV